MNRFKTRAARRDVRAFLRQLASVDDALNAGAEPERHSEWREFTDHLRPMDKFLQARAGRPWDWVWAELTARYDRRTLKGWHLLTTHVIGHMVDGPWSRLRPLGTEYGAYVDDAGILRYKQRRHR